MSRFFERRHRSDLAVTVLIVLAAVAVADVDDYGLHLHAMLSSASDSSIPANGPPEITPATSASESDLEHVCCCLLCLMTLPLLMGPRVLPPSAGKLPGAPVAGLALSPHTSEIFHPPSA